MHFLVVIIVTAAQLGSSTSGHIQTYAKQQTEAARVAGVSSSLLTSGRIVTIHGIAVDGAIAGKLTAMIAEARTAGIVLSGTGWRSLQSQINLRTQNCGPTADDIYKKVETLCTPPTAVPGTSMHEKGLAIDFANCPSRSTVTYQWLAGHASQYGFYNRADEAWHWSTNGR